MTEHLLTQIRLHQGHVDGALPSEEAGGPHQAVHAELLLMPIDGAIREDGSREAGERRRVQVDLTGAPSQGLGAGHIALFELQEGVGIGLVDPEDVVPEDLAPGEAGRDVDVLRRADLHTPPPAEVAAGVVRLARAGIAQLMVYPMAPGGDIVTTLDRFQIEVMPRVRAELERS